MSHLFLRSLYSHNAQNYTYEVAQRWRCAKRWQMTMAAFIISDTTRRRADVFYIISFAASTPRESKRGKKVVSRNICWLCSLWLPWLQGGKAQEELWMPFDKWIDLLLDKLFPLLAPRLQLPRGAHSTPRSRERKKHSQAAVALNKDKPRALALETNVLSVRRTLRDA